jgi:hypothetical protein
VALWNLSDIKLPIIHRKINPIAKVLTKFMTLITKKEETETDQIKTEDEEKS